MGTKIQYAHRKPWINRGGGGIVNKNCIEGGEERRAVIKKNSERNKIRSMRRVSGFKHR